MEGKRITFPLGVASSSYQIEGGWNSDEKGESIWDRWTHIPGNSKATGDIACDHYHHWEQDLLLLKELGVDSYRFSVSWPRVMPDGRGRVNQTGLDFYRNIIRCLREYGISPAVTLNHWDLPQKLQDIGGWANPDSPKYFQSYAEVMFDTLGDDVDIWITHNEPWVVAFVGHVYGSFAPGHKDISEALAASHHMLLGHGLAVRSFREKKRPGKIGITLDYFPTFPEKECEMDCLAAQRDRESHLNWFADPIFHGHYPEMLQNHYQSKGVILPSVGPDDMEIIKAPIDFLGVNYYRTNTVRHCPDGNWPFDNAFVTDPSDSSHAAYRIRPESLYNYLNELNEAYHPSEILITENGFAAHETPDRFGRILDYDRINYIYLHIEQCIRAQQAGIPIAGYYVWSFLDDLEWTGGYSDRMGLIRVNYETMERTIKESGWWYQRVLKSRLLVD